MRLAKDGAHERSCLAGKHQQFLQSRKRLAASVQAKCEKTFCYLRFSRGYSRCSRSLQSDKTSSDMYPSPSPSRTLVFSSLDCGKLVNSSGRKGLQVNSSKAKT